MQNLYHLPDQVTDRRGALTEPLACALRAVDRSGLRSGDRVGIIGAGPIGLLLLSLARASGATWVVVSEPNPFRRELATRLGADLVIDPNAVPLTEAVLTSTGGTGVDVAFEAVGMPAAIEIAQEIVAPGGLLVVVGVTDVGARATIDPQRMFLRELTICGVRGPTYAVDRALRWLAILDLEPIVTHAFPIEGAVQAVEFALAGNTGKVVLEPSP
jgi:threonine dehydrogenase-like Zn-dependent dehydrogenase